jgi:hypothetical protein
VIGLVESSLRLALPERLSECGHETYVTNRALRLRRRVPSLSVERCADVDQLVVEVDVSPVKAQEFALAESAEDGRGKEGPAAG